MKPSIYQQFTERKAKGQKSFAVLIDPDKVNTPQIDQLIALSKDANVDYFFVGGSLVTGGDLDNSIRQIKAACDIPVVLFPGSPMQVSAEADALLYLSLISGRNAELLIGQHVMSAPIVRKSRLEIIPTGYMIVDGGAPTSVSYMSNTTPLPADKDQIAVCTAIAGEMLGLRTIYMDAGSGAKYPISESMIASVAKNVDVPVIVGGGISDPEKAYLNCKAGADIVVVGNAIEKDPMLVKEIGAAIKSLTVNRES